MKKPQFKPHFHVEVIEPDTVYLLSEQSHFALTGRLYCQLAPLLDGNHTVGQIISELKEQVPFTSIYYALNKLKSKGYITDAIAPVPPEVAAFWSLLNIDPKAAFQVCQKTLVSVTAFGDVPVQPFITALESLGIQVSPHSEIPSSQSLAVVLTDDYLQPDLQQFNQATLKANLPWLLVKPVGAVLWLGPIFYPQKTGCWHCLAQRLYGNREVEAAIQQQKGSFTHLPTSRAILPSTLQTGLNLAATEIAKWIVLESGEQTHAIPTLESKILTFNLTSPELQTHILTKRPQCPACGDIVDQRERQPQPIILTSQKKQFTADGGHRAFSPDRTLKQYEHHISPITGIVSALVRISEPESNLIHTYMAVHNFGSAADLKSLRHLLHNKGAGKGKSDLQSRASGFCEALERYSGLYQGDEIRIKSTYTQLEDRAIHPLSCLHFSETQYQNRETLNQQYSNIDWIPEPFDETKEIEWTPVWSLTQQTFKYLPTALCYYNYPLPPDHLFGLANSNGSAAGNTLEEAILQGFMELVERDSVGIWWYNRIHRPAVDLASFDDPYLVELQAYYRTQQREFWVLDLTADLGIPVFAAVSRRIDGGAEEILLGYGAHFDPKIALLRAVTEMNQPLTRLDQHNRGTGNTEGLINRWLTTATIQNQPYLVPDRRATPKAYIDYPQHWSDDLRDDVLVGVNIAKQHGLETLVLEQTRPDIGLKVVKVIVPGLRHFWPRFGLGRLYDVPVKMGWLPTPLAEEQMNPIPMPF
ncbi:MAG: TOMM precursor leader peptide-binding protein [Coleofasciculus sp. S288]|nr:TOMM precursor leader peptide-binding protein [Coleofasciculus sp. S288]